MSRKKLQFLLSAGVFSAALLSGAAYADDNSSGGSQVQVSSGTDASGQGDQASQSQATGGKQKASAKSGSDMGCSSANGCGNH